MLQMSVDFRDEVDEFHRFLETLAPSDWERETGFLAWTPWDVVAHLHYFDLVSRASLGGEEVFAPERKNLLAAAAAGRTSSCMIRWSVGRAARRQRSREVPVLRQTVSPKALILSEISSTL